MPLSISYISRLEDVLAPAAAFLEQDRDLFERPRIVVPTAGAKAWLTGALARRLGRPAGAAADDGIVANVEIAYPGTILGLLQPPRGPATDPWAFDRLTFAVLDVITDPLAAAIGIPFDVNREPLLAARRIAGLFDEYHIRRPGMILEWERERPSRVMTPTANDEQRDGIPVPDTLPDQDRWQFDVWRAVRQRIAAPSPPARAGVDQRSPHAPLLVAGLESLSWPQLEALERLAEACPVRALVVHPSPGLREAWRRVGPGPLPTDLRGRPLRRNRRTSAADAADEADDSLLPDGFDPLPATWLAGARELQDLLESQGIATVEPQPVAAAAGADSLLARMQATVASGHLPEPRGHDPAADHSLVIHRCHSLSRQAEVLHDALLHAFADPCLAGLAPHDVVIMSPCLEEAAPHLEAVFQRTVVGRDAAGRPTKLRLPLIVADRGIRAVSPALDLLMKLLALPGARCSVDDVLDVAGHPLVRSHLGADDDTVATWLDLVDRTQVRWGLDHAHRERRGLAIAAPDLRDIHTWRCGLEQMLLGVAVPDAPARPELGDVVPLGDLDPADVEPIAKLVRALDIVGGLATAADGARPVPAWCDAIETALVALCGEECGDLAEPLGQLRRLREAAGGATADRAVAFEEVRTLLAEWFEEKAGRQPLRTGAITATSMVPLRGVPFRVVCVIGYDDGAVAAAEPAKDDLVARMPLLGDLDPRTEPRRALLDCVLAAQDRLVITCTGRNVRTNEPVPLVTPLAELVDFAIRHGVGRERPGGPSGIEVEHPRHHLGRRNFLPGAVQPGLIWSHDSLAAAVAAGLGQRREDVGAVPTTPRSPAPARAAGPPEALEIEIAVLEQLARDPLRLYLQETLGISTWRDDEAATPATLPLELSGQAERELTLELIRLLATQPAAAADWSRAVRQSGRLPLGPHGDAQLAVIEQLAHGIVARSGRDGVPLTTAASPGVRIELGGCRIVGRLEGLSEETRQLVILKAGKAERKSASRPLHVAAIRLLVARAAGLAVDRVSIVSRNGTWKPGATSKTGKPVDPCQIRRVVLANDIDPLARLAELCDLIREALAAPRGLFGLDETDVTERRKAFDAFVSARNWATQEPLYPSTAEAAVYGLHPVFDAIFAAGSAELSFLDRYRGDLGLQSRPGSSEYTLP